MPNSSVGALLGLALGDAYGAPHEGGPVERLVWRVIGKTVRGEKRWTDDTQMALDLAESLVELGEINPDDLAQRFAQSYRWSRGYGPGAAKVLKRIRSGEPWRTASKSQFADGSYGNGAAMRAPVVGIWFAHQPERLLAAARTSSLPTHAHPLGVEGALIAAATTGCLLRGEDNTAIMAHLAAHCEQTEFLERIKTAKGWLLRRERPAPTKVAESLGNGIQAAQSVITSVYLALSFRDETFKSLMDFAVSGGGDTDTIAAMAGAFWGASNGASALPDDLLASLEDRQRIEALARSLAARRP